MDRETFVAAEICSATGISRVQLDIWANRAGIAAGGDGRRVYDADAVELLKLIKEGKERGLDLRAAIAAARAVVR